VTSPATGGHHDVQLVCLLMTVALASVACSLIAPIADIKPTPACDGSTVDCSDTQIDASIDPTEQDAGASLQTVCASRGDGVCDEPQGTGRCPINSDSDDCNCPRAAGNSCDPIAQCGCATDQTCEATLNANNNDAGVEGASAWSAQCVISGSGEVGETCATTSDCQHGLFCHEQRKRCLRYCSAGSGCGTGGCLSLTFDVTSSLGACGIPCSPSQVNACEIGETCVLLDQRRPELSSVPGSYCLVPLREQCPRQDGICDEPRSGGTGLCVEGADSIDCCPPKTTDRECDPSEQCGCELKPGTACVHTPLTQITRCVEFGAVPPGGACSYWRGQCTGGYQCQNGICRKYCDNNMDCKIGEICRADATSGTGACVVGSNAD